MEDRQLTITVLPEFGDAYKVIIPVPNNINIPDEDYIDYWMNDNLINVHAWECVDYNS